MAASLFHLDREGSLNVLREADFESDADIQDLIAQHPSLIGGDADEPGAWFAIRRQGASPSGAGSIPPWSVDHLFLADDGVPTIVDIRRAADGRSGGDPFGQILFYAANAADWWTAEALREAFAATHACDGRDPGTALAQLVGKTRSRDGFWREVEANLAAGRVRMVLVADHVKPELTRMVEFLTWQLRDAEVWVLEVRQKVAPSGRLLQTSIIGRRPPYAQPPLAKPETPTRSRAAAVAAPNPRDAWVSALRERCDTEEAAALDDLLRWMSEQYGATFITGPPNPAFRLSVKEAGKDRFPFGVTEAKTASIHLGSLAASRAYEADDARRALVDEISAAGLQVADVDLKGDLRVTLKSLGPPEVRARVLTVMDGVMETLRLKEAASAFVL